MNLRLAGRPFLQVAPVSAAALVTVPTQSSGITAAQFFFFPSLLAAWKSELPEVASPQLWQNLSLLRGQAEFIGSRGETGKESPEFSHLKR